MNIKNCKHERKTSFAVSSHSVQHDYCPSCGWHKYKGKEYSKQEWHNTFLKDEYFSKEVKP